MKRFSKRFGGTWLAPLRFLVVAAVWTPVAAAVVGAIFLARLADQIPDTPDLDSLRPTYGSTVETRTGWRIAGAESVDGVAWSDLEPTTIAAFLAAEDADFFEHRAFNLKAIIRAALTNLRTGEVAQGASTITQQVAKRFLSSDKTLRRKLTELLMARRIEASYSKTEILDVYLNASYFGERARGISQASWTYFGKPATQLQVGEAALLAGILPAPSIYNPRADLERAKSQRDHVLRRMGELGLLAEARVDQEVRKPVEVARRRDVQPERMPYAAASAMRVLGDHFDAPAWSEGGYRVVVQHDPARQARARRSLREGIEALDERQGWRGPLGTVGGADEADQLLADQVLVDQDRAADFVLARLTSVDREVAAMVTAGGEEDLQLDQARWAAPADRKRHYKRPARLDDLREILEPGDLVTVRRRDEAWRLVQPPTYEGGLMVVDSPTGALLASVGGYDADRSIFHRAEQACRQPGSVFKPVVYGEALSQGLTAATMLSDLPDTFETGRGSVWQPKNADDDFKGYVTLADALAWSRNIPTVHLMDYLGPQSVVERARKLGITSELDTTSSVALGASCARPAEITRAYAALQRRGYPPTTSPVAYIADSDGDILVDRDHFAAPDWSTAARLDRMATPPPAAERGVSAQVAYILTRLLRRVVTAGTAHDLPDEWPVAGKTGTTNEFDAWFVGFDGDLTATVWVGSDQNDRPLGRGEHGATVAMPVFERFYADEAPGGAALGRDEPPPRIVTRRIDPQTGLRSQPGEPAVELPFIEGTAPTDFAPTRGTRQAEQLDSLVHEF